MTAHRTFGSAACLTAALMLTGCSSDTQAPAAGPAPYRASSSAGAPSSPNPAENNPTKSQVPVPAGVAGAGCADYVLVVPTGPGALDGMGRDPVAVALGNTPLLTTFAGALMGNLNPQVNLFDAVNTGQLTVFAPTDEAFAKVSPETVEKLKGDPKLLTDVLDYHVVQGQMSPEDIVGDHKTVQGQSLTVSGSGESLRVNDAAVVCGGIRTANATVYLIDTVLTPPTPAPPTTTTTTSGTESGTETGTESGENGTESSTESPETEATPTG